MNLEEFHKDFDYKRLAKEIGNNIVDLLKPLLEELNDTSQKNLQEILKIINDKNN